MTISATSVTVTGLLDAFASPPDEDVHEGFQRLADVLWRAPVSTELVLEAVPELLARLAEVDDRRKGYLAILLGLVAEAEYPATDSPVATAVRDGLEECIETLSGVDKDHPLSYAVRYLLSHFPGDRDRILAAVSDLGLNAEDYSRLDRALQALDPADPVLGRVFPSPDVWTLDESEREFDRRWISALSPAQIEENWHNDTETVYGSTGAKAYWAVCNWASPAPLPPASVPARDAIPRPADPAADIFTPHTAALRCPGCGGRFEFVPHLARCQACEASYPITAGILDLTKPLAEDRTGDFQFKLAEMPTMGLFYEAHARPNFLRISGSNWGGDVTPTVEDEYIARHVSPVDGPVLDLAAGAGRWTEILAAAVGAERVIALDLNPPMLAVLRARLPEIPAIMASAVTLPFEDASLGAVLCWNALQAFPADAAAAIAEVGRCLRPGGTFTLMTFRNSPDPVYRHFVGSHHFPQHSAGLHLFDPDEIRGWLASAGLTVREETSPGTFLFITAERPSTSH